MNTKCQICSKPIVLTAKVDGMRLCKKCEKSIKSIKEQFAVESRMRDSVKFRAYSEDQTVCTEKDEPCSGRKP